MQPYDETTTSAEELLTIGVWNTWSFGPALREDGEIIEGIDNIEIDHNFGNHSIQGYQPRSGVGSQTITILSLSLWTAAAKVTVGGKPLQSSPRCSRTWAALTLITVTAAARQPCIF